MNFKKHLKYFQMFSKKENLVNPKNQPIQKCQSKHKRKFEVGN